MQIKVCLISVIMKTFTVCRVCLGEETNQTTMQLLFDKDNPNCNDILQKIEECGGIIIKPSDEFPKYICQECLGLLEVSYKFRTLCQASQNALINKITIKSEMELETTDLDLLQPQTIFLEESFNQKEEIFCNKELIKKSKTVNISPKKSVKEEILQINDDNEKLNNDNKSSDSEYQPDELDTESFDELNKKYKMKSNRNQNPSKFSNKVKLSVMRKRQKSSLTVSKLPKSELITRNRKKKNDPPLKIMCELCGNMYSKQSILNLHMRRHLDEKPYICELCNKAFACQAEINRHMRVHTGAKPFACRFCGRTFGDRSTNLKHERIHTNERPFSCKTCGKAFSYSNVLKNHMLTHTGEKPFRCIPCDKTFSRKHQLAQHLATRTHQHTLNSTFSNDVKQDHDLM